MDLTDKSQLMKYLKEKGIWANKGLSQNFLVDRGSLDKIVEAAEIKPDDLIVEIGPGVGTLTQELINKPNHVVSIELDPKLAALLQENYSSFKNFELICADVLRTNIGEIVGSKKYKVVANIPYAITSKIIKLFLTEKNKPESLVMLVQKEVAERICAKPGDMSILAISVQLYGQPEIVDIVPKESFFPSPKVDSAILRIVIARSGSNEPACRPFDSEAKAPPLRLEEQAGQSIDRHAALAMTDHEEKTFFRCVNVGFSSRRKKLLNNLSSGYHLDRKKVSDIMKKVRINEGARAQELTVLQWLELSKLIN